MPGHGGHQDEASLIGGAEATRRYAAESLRPFTPLTSRDLPLPGGQGSPGRWKARSGVLIGAALGLALVAAVVLAVLALGRMG